MLCWHELWWGKIKAEVCSSFPWGSAFKQRIYCWLLLHWETTLEPDSTRYGVAPPFVLLCAWGGQHYWPNDWHQCIGDIQGAACNTGRQLTGCLYPDQAQGLAIPEFCKQLQWDLTLHVPLITGDEGNLCTLLSKGLHTTQPVSSMKFSLLQTAVQDGQLVREQQGPPAMKGILSWEQSMIPRQVGAVALPIRSWHAVWVSSRFTLNWNTFRVKWHFIWAKMISTFLMKNSYCV